MPSTYDDLSDLRYTTDLLRYGYPDLHPGITTKGSGWLLPSPAATYSVYNNQDRMLNVVYRYYTIGGLTGLVDAQPVWGQFGVAQRPLMKNQVTWAYESSVNLLTQQMWTSAAWIGLGRMLFAPGAADIDSDDDHKRQQAAFALARHVVITFLESTLHLFNGFRWSAAVKEGQLPGADAGADAYAKEVKTFRTASGAMASFGFALNNIVGIYAAQRDLKVKEQTAGTSSADLYAARLMVANQTVGFALNFSKGMSSLASFMDKPLLLKGKTWGIAGTALGFAQGVISMAGLGVMLNKPNLSQEEKNVILAEMGLQVASGVIQGVSNLVLAANIARGLTTGLAVSGPALGMVAAAAMLTMSPIQIYGMVQQSRYADALDELGERTLRYGYAGDPMLADLYRDKVFVDASFMAGGATLATIGTAVAVAAAVTGIGAPVAAIVTLGVAIAGALLPLFQQDELEDIARDYAEKITATEGGSFAFFDHSMGAQYGQMVASTGLRDYLRTLQLGYGVDSVVGVTTASIAKTALELSAITRLADQLRTTDSFIDRFVGGEVRADRTLAIDPVGGTISVAGQAGTSQLLTFITPLLAPGEERRVRASTGKNAYTTYVDMMFPENGQLRVVDWSIDGGDASTIFDVRNVASRLRYTVPTYGLQYDTSGVHEVVTGTVDIMRSIGLDITGGSGDDTLIANASPTRFFGGGGVNSASYEHLVGPGETGGIVVTSEDGWLAHSQVQKQVDRASIYVDQTSKENFSYGKRSEAVYYRDVKVEQAAINELDYLFGVQNITGTRGNDSITGGSSDNHFRGLAGNDMLDGADGNDVLAGGRGYDTLRGGAGEDTIDYSDVEGAAVSLDMDLNPGSFRVYDTPHGEWDDVFGVENVRGSAGDDRMVGDGARNVLFGMGGNDQLWGMGGDDVLSGGTGANWLDGGQGSDTADYSDGAAGTAGVWASLQAPNALRSYGVAFHGWLANDYFYPADASGFDRLANIENLVGSAAGDYLEGNEAGNQLAGNAGDDTLLGRDGSDILIGGRGNDVLEGGEGQDTIDYSQAGAGIRARLRESEVPDANPIWGYGYRFGGADPYALYGKVSQRYLAATASGFDWVRGIENVIGTPYGDLIAGNEADNQLAGGAGDDLLVGWDGNDALDVGPGVDRAYGGAGDDIVFTSVRTSFDDPTDASTHASDTFDGGAGMDTLDYSMTPLSADGLRPGTGRVGIQADLSAGRVVKDVEFGVTPVHDDAHGFENVIGTEYDDVLRGEASDNVLVGNGGNDELVGLGGADLLAGGYGADTLWGGVGDDVLAGGAGVDQLHGEQGDDVLQAGGGADLLDGGEGSDTADFHDGLPVAVDLVSQSATYGPGLDVQLAGIENVRGSAGGDTIHGSDAGNELSGLAGADALYGGLGDDYLDAGPGFDTVDGGEGNDWIVQRIERVQDSLIGGAGNDIADYSKVGSLADGTRWVTTRAEVRDAANMVVVQEQGLYTPMGIVADLAAGTGQDPADGIVEKFHGITFADAGDAGVDILRGIESIVGTGLNDSLRGNGGANALVGGAGDDVIDGRAGNDLLRGDEGDDEIHGGDDNDAMIGGAGKDRLYGDAGDDVIHQDLERVDDSIDGGAGADHVDYRITLFANDLRSADGMNLRGIVADLDAGTVIKYAGVARPAGVLEDGIDYLSGIEAVTGTYQDDILRGDRFDNVLAGDEGRDLIEGRDGNDVLSGGAGRDTVRGGAGNDTFSQDVIEALSDLLDGGAGIDTVDYSLALSGSRSDNGAAPDQGIHGDLALQRVNKYWGGSVVTGVDRLASIENLRGTTLDDTLLGDARMNVLGGDDGNDTLQGRGGNDYLNGDAGDDAIEGGSGGDVVAGGDGNDVIHAGDGDDNLLQSLGRGNDTLDGGSGRNTVDYSLSQTQIDDGLRTDGMGHAGIVADLGQGRVQKYGDPQSDVDTLVSIQNITGTWVDDSLTGDTGNNLLVGLDGNDSLSALSGDDGLDGGAGNDTLRGGDDDDIVTGGTGNDSMEGGQGDDVYYVRSGDGQDILTEVGGSDVLALGATRAGHGFNARSVWFTRSGVNRDGADLVVQGLGSTDRVTVAGWFTSDAARLETIVSSDGFVLQGSDLADMVAAISGWATPPASVPSNLLALWRRIDTGATITSGAGADTLDGGAGNDSLDGGEGHDTLRGLGGDDMFYQSVDDATIDRFDGGDGNDTVSYDAVPHRGGTRADGSTAGVNVNLATQNGLTATAQKSQGNYDIFTSIENVTGSDLNDTVAGDDAANQLAGDAGDDALTGAAGDDTLVGGQGQDTIDGGAGADTYVFRRGDGVDTVRETAAAGSADRDVIRFVSAGDGEGLLPTDLWFSALNDGRDLRVSVLGTDDAVTIADWFVDATKRVEFFVASDGRSLGAADVAGLVAAMSGPTPDQPSLMSAATVAAVRSLWKIGVAPTGSVTLSGVAAQGSQLTASVSIADVDGVAGEVTIRWQSSPAGQAVWTDIAGATDGSFTLTQAQVGRPVRAVAGYVDGLGHWQTVASAASAPVANVNDAPTGDVFVTGTMTLNAALTASNSLWDVDGPGAVTYRWQQWVTDLGWSDITGAVGARFTLGSAQVGHLVRVVASYADAFGITERASTPVANVTGGNSASIGALVIGGSGNGTLSQGMLLTANAAMLDDPNLGLLLSTLTLRWQSAVDGQAWSDITGATGTTFSVTQAEVGRRVRVVASYVDGAGTAESVMSAPTAVVVDADDAAAGTLRIIGSAAQGQTLQATPVLTDRDGVVAVSYRWESSAGNGHTWRPIGTPGAQTLTLGQAEVGRQVRVTADVTDHYGRVSSVASGATALVANVNDAPAAFEVRLLGPARQGSDMSVSTVVFDADAGRFIAPAEMTVQWQASSDQGASWRLVGMGPRFRPEQTDVGSIVRAVVEYTDDFGTVERVQSSPSAAIADVNDAPEGAVLIAVAQGEGAAAPTEGQVVSAVNKLRDAEGLGAVSYQWQVFDGGWIDIAGAMQDSFMLTAAEGGKQLRVVARYVDGAGASQRKASDALAVGALANHLPSGELSVLGLVNGVARQGATLIAEPGSFGDADGSGALSCAWEYSDDYGSTFSAAGSGARLTLGAAMVGRLVRAKATYTDGNGTLETVYGPTREVANVNDKAEGIPTWSFEGGFAQGTTLHPHAWIQDADGMPPGGVEYQWQSTPDHGVTWADLPYGRGDLVLTQAEVGRQLRLVASYVDNEGTLERVASQMSATVANVNDAPESSYIEVQRAIAGAAFSFDASQYFRDPDGDYLNYGFRMEDGSSLPSWLHESSERLWGTPGENDAGDITITVSAVEPSAHASFTFQLSVVGPVGYSMQPDANGAVVLIGDASGQTLWGTRHEDVIWGRGGNDVLIGEFGADRYHFQRGDGTDSIWELDVNAGEDRDVLAFGPDIGASQLWFERVGDDLQISLIGTLNDKVTVKNWYREDVSPDQPRRFSAMGQPMTPFPSRIETFVAGDGKTLMASQVDALVTAMAPLIPPPLGTTTLPAAMSIQLASALSLWSNPGFVAAAGNHAPVGNVLISGPLQQGATVTASHTLQDADGPGALNVSYEWQSSSDNGLTWAAVGTGSQHSLTTEDALNLVRVVASYSDATGKLERVGSTPATVQNINDPGSVSISGPDPYAPLYPGQRLTANVSDLDGTPGTVTYQWQVAPPGTASDSTAWVNVAGQEGTFFDFVPTADLGTKLVRVKATYNDQLFGTPTTVQSAAYYISPINSAGAVAIEGSAVQGGRLSAHVSDADGTAGVQVSYQWESSSAVPGTGIQQWVPIAGATSSTLDLTQALVDQVVRVRVTYHDQYGWTENVISAATRPVANVNDAGSVWLSSTHVEQNGLLQTIMADSDGIEGPVAYQWEVADTWQGPWTAIEGATAADFTPLQGQVGRWVRVHVSYTDAHGTAETRWSASSGVLNANDAGFVAVDGTAAQNQTLSARVFDGDAVNGPVTYQWKMAPAGTDVTSNAWVAVGGPGSSPDVTLGQNQVGKVLRVWATYSDWQNTPEGVVSAETGVVLNANDPGTVTALFTADNLLATLLTDADGLDGVAVSYQWQMAPAGTAADSTSWADIAGATASTFSLGMAQAQRSVRVVAEYTDRQGSAERVVSDALAVKETMYVGVSSVQGTAQQNQLVKAAVADNSGVVGPIAYRWQVAPQGTTADSTAWADIAGAAASWMTLTQHQVGKTVRVVTTYTDGFGVLKNVASAPTAAVTSNPLAGTAGNDVLSSALGSYTVLGQAGDDVLQDDAATPARYLRIYHSNTTNGTLSLTELQVWARTANGLVNVAAGRPSTVGIDSGTYTAYANSGSALTNGLGAGASWNSQAGSGSNLAWVSRNSGSGSVYIELDLGAAYDLDSLVLWGRSDFVAEAQQLRVMASAVPFAGDYNALSADPAVWRVDTAGPLAGGVPVTLRGAPQGDYIPVSDLFDGGAGSDTVDYSTSLVDQRAALRKGVNVDLAAGSGDKWFGGAASNVIDTYAGIENVIGTAQQDRLLGDSGANLLDGGAGDDTLDGRDGNDTLRSGTGRDTLTGGAGNDALQDTDVARGRYLRIYHNGNTTNATLSLTELQVWARTASGLVNVAAGRPSTVGIDSGTYSAYANSGSALTNGAAAGASWNNQSGSGSNLAWVSRTSGSGGVYIELDLGALYDLESLVLWGRSDFVGEAQQLRVMASAAPFAGDYNALSADPAVWRVDTVGPASGAIPVTLAYTPQADTFDGGTGNDTLDYAASLVNERAASGRGVSVDLSGATANDKWWSAAAAGGVADVVSGIENVTGTAQSDRLTGDATANLLSGGAGNDTLSNGEGADTLSGGDGDDLLRDTDASPAVRGRYVRVYHSDAGATLGLSELQVFSSGVNVAAGKTARASSDSGSVSTFYSNFDALTNGQALGAAWNGSAGSNSNLAWVSGGTKPYIELDLGAVFDIDQLVLWGRNDQYAGQQANLRVMVGISPLSGDYAALSASPSVWRIDTSGPITAPMSATVGFVPQADSFNGGAGVDTLDYSASLVAQRATLGRGVSIDLSGATSNDKWWSAAAGGGVADVVTGVENLTGTAQSDRLTGDGSANVLVGAAGNDTLKGGLGNDTLDGGAGVDTADFSDAALGDGNGLQALMSQGRVNTGRYANGVVTPNVFDTLVGIENIVGTRNNDALWGDGSANRLEGGDGIDMLSGDSGDDTLIAGAGADSLSGVTGNDTLDGGDGNDLMNGGTGNDLLGGGTGADGYRLAQGDGVDLLDETDVAGSTSKDIVRFVGGTADSGLWFSRVGNDLRVNRIGSGDQLTVSNWYVDNTRQVERFVDSYGRALSSTDVSALAGAMTGALPAQPQDVPGAALTAIDSLWRWSVAVAGTVQEGQVLTASVVDTDIVTGTVTWKWQSAASGTAAESTAWTDIAGQTGSTLTLTHAVVTSLAGRSVRAVAGYTSPFDDASTAMSTATAALAAAHPGSATISGTPAQNQVLTAAVSDIDGVNGPTFQWQWAAGINGPWTDIAGATGSTFALTQAQVGRVVRVVAAYTDGQGAAESVASAPTSAIANLNDAGSATISGTPLQDQVLAATVSDADGLAGVTVSYRWQSAAPGTPANGTWNDIAGATAQTFALTQAQVGKIVRVVASYTDQLGTSEAAASAPSATIANVNDAGTVAIGGTATQNQVLTATVTDVDGLAGVAVSYRWQSAAPGTPANGTWTDIAGATASTFTLTQAQVGSTVRVVASYTDQLGGAENAISAASTSIANVNDSGAVAISGTLAQNQVLTATVADADGLAGVTVSYRWQSAAPGTPANGSWTDIAGATASTFMLTQAQVGSIVRAVASYTDQLGGVENAISAASATIANVNDAGAVSVTGTTAQNQTLTAAVTDADGLAGVTVSYRWQSATPTMQSAGIWVDIAGATSSTLLLTQAQVGRAVRVVASYTDQLGGVENVVSAASATVANVNDAGAVAISGTPTQNQVLAANVTDADGLAGVTVSYRWQSATPEMQSANIWTDISGATASTLLLAQAQVGRAVRVVASYVDALGGVESATSAASAAIANVNDEGSVSIGGTATQNQVLTAFLWDPDGLSGATVSYRWQSAAAGTPANGTWTDIAGATASTITLTQAQVGKIVRVVASYTDQLGTSEAVTSAASVPIADVNDVGVVILSGTPTQNQVLTASVTDAEGVVGGTVSYRWQSAPPGTPANGSWTDIAGATASTFTLTQAQVGKVVRAVANFMDQVGTVEAVASPASATIANINLSPTGTVTVQGAPIANHVLMATNTLVDPDGMGPVGYYWDISFDGGATFAVEGSGGGPSLFLAGNYGGTVVRARAYYTDGDGAFNTAFSPNVLIAINEAPQLGTQPASQSAVTGAAFSYVLPAATFTDANTAETLTYRAALWNGTPLPGWITFDAATGRFEGTPTTSDESVTLRVVATDAGGLQAVAPFRLTVQGGNTANEWLLDECPTLQGIMYNGGAGNDTLDYSASLVADRASDYRGIDVDLAAGTTHKWYDSLGAGSSGFADVLIGIENVVGTAMSDRLQGDAGANMLSGGRGFDTLIGGAGSDTYVFGPGNLQHDATHYAQIATIVETTSTTDVDVVSFTSSSDQLWFQRSGADLVVSIIGCQDRLTISNWYASSPSQVEVINAGDGKRLLNTQVDALVDAMAAVAPPAYGQTILLPNYQSQLAPALAAWSSN